MTKHWKWEMSFTAAHVVLCLIVTLVFAITLPMDLTVVSFTLAVNNFGSGWLNFKNIRTICQLL